MTCSAPAHAVVRVPTRLMAGARRGGREPGKSDPIDAEAVALAALRHDGLPVAELDGPAREVRLLVDHRRDLVAERTRIGNRLRWYLHELDPTLAVSHPAGCAATASWTPSPRGSPTVTAQSARVVAEQLARCRELTVQINAARTRAAHSGAPARPDPAGPARLRGALGGGASFAETAGARRFRNKDAYARFTGTAPIPVWSGNTAGKVRLNRGGNRTANCALHMIAVTQTRGIGRGASYHEKLLAAGKTRTEALRLLRRRVSDAVFAALRADEPRATAHPPSSAVARTDRDLAAVA